jgi:tRNA 2-selenouridine synthase
MKAMAPHVIAQVAAEGLTPAHLEQVAAQVEEALQTMEI